MPISIIHQFRHEILLYVLRDTCPSELRPEDHRLSLTETSMADILAACRAAYQPANGDMTPTPRYVPGTGRRQRHEDTPLSLAGLR